MLAHLPNQTQERPLARLAAFLGALRVPFAQIEKQLPREVGQLAVDVRQDGPFVGARQEYLRSHAGRQAREVERPL